MKTLFEHIEEAIEQWLKTRDMSDDGDGVYDDIETGLLEYLGYWWDVSLDQCDGDVNATESAEVE